MTATTILGKVAIIPKGIWNAESAYSKLNAVTLGGSSYLAVQDVPAGTSVSNTTYWQMLAEKGTSGGVGQLADEFSTNNAYAVGDYCSYNQDVYRFVSPHLGAWDVSDVMLVSIANELKSKMTAPDVAALIEEGTSAKAEKLETARNIAVDLASNTAASFDGSQNISTGVTGVLSIANGGTGNNEGSVAKLSTARALQTDLESQTAVSFDGSENASIGVTGVLPKTNGGTGNINGTADKLTTPRTIRTNLGSTSTASFDGSADVTPGVTGVLPIANGGTGNANGTADKLTTARDLSTNLASSSSASFDGSGNASIGVTGLLSVANGGNGYGDSGEKSITNASVFTGTLYYRRTGRILHIWNKAALKIKTALTGDYVTLATLGSAYRVTQSTRGTAAVANSLIPVSVVYSDSGNINLYRGKQDSITTSNNIYISIIAVVE